jgi:transcriptional regulator with XRE-family HTH domain
MSSDPNINTLLGSKVKELRAKNKITREALAERIGVSSRFLADVEGGKVGVSLSTLVSICLELGISSDYLLGLTGRENMTEYDMIIERIKQTPPEYLEHLNTIVTAYTEAVRDKDN